MLDLERKYRIVAGAGNHGDVEALFAAIAADTADVRTKLPKDVADSADLRRAVAVILNNAIDTLRRYRKNVPQRAEVRSEDSV